MGDKEIQEKIEKLKAEIAEKRATQNGSDAFSEVQTKYPLHPEKPLTPRRQLKGHFGKVYACHWAGKGTNLISASQDGKLIFWNTRTTNKIRAIPLKSSWVMSCTYEQKSDEWVASGGLDNICSVFKANIESNASRPDKELTGHDGYMSSCVFVNGSQNILTASGDSTCMLWDVERGEAKNTYSDHSADVMAVATSPSQPNVFVSGSCDSTAKLWDLRAKKSHATFKGHESDINSVAFFPSGNSFVSGSDDSSCRMWDLRSLVQINEYGNDRLLCGIQDVEFSQSGRILFAGYDDFTCHGWDTLKGREQISMKLQAHENRVVCLSVAPDGSALTTGSWDTLLKVWA